MPEEKKSDPLTSEQQSFFRYQRLKALGSGISGIGTIILIAGLSILCCIAAFLMYGGTGH